MCKNYKYIHHSYYIGITKIIYNVHNNDNIKFKNIICLTVILTRRYIIPISAQNCLIE